MKKLTLVIALVAAAAVANAQDMMSKKGTPILPEVNDWWISVSVNPWLEYMGNLMNGSTSNSSPSWSFTNSDQIITGGMVKDENTSYRAKIRLGFGSGSSETGDTSSGALSKIKSSGNFIGLGAGIQKNRGNGRLRGIYGAEAMISISGSKDTYEYNGTPATGSLLEDKSGSEFGITIRGFLGAEYFFAPKISLSGEFGWGLAFMSMGADEMKYEGGSTVSSGKGSSFGLDTDNMSGSINMSFYF